MKPTLRRLCGWEGAGSVPSRATFSRAIAEFADSELPGRLHEVLLNRTLEGHLAGHVSRDSTAIEGRESLAPEAALVPWPKRWLGRPRKGEQRPKQLSRLQWQASMTPEQMLEELPKACNIGVKTNGKGHLERWTGYKLHLNAIDDGIPVSCLLTSASVHDSQAAIPLATLTSRRVDGLYDLMDSAYDSSEIRAFSEKLGQVPIIDVNPRRRARCKRNGSGRRRRAVSATCRSGAALPRTHHRRADQQSAQRGVWRTPPGTGQRVCTPSSSVGEAATATGNRRRSGLRTQKFPFKRIFAVG